MNAIRANNQFGKTVNSGTAAIIYLYAGFGLLSGLADILVERALESYPWQCLGSIIFGGFEAVLIVALLTRRETSVKNRLRDSEERMSLAVKAAGLGLWDWDIENDLVWFTEECRSLYGIPSHSSLTYQGFLQYLHPDDRVSTHDAIQRALADDTEYRCEYRVVGPDGGLRWVTAMGRGCYDELGRPLRLRGVSMDATSRKQAEQEAQLQRQAMAHMARLNTLGELSSMLAHELNQPLAAILGNAQAGQRFLAQTPPDLGELRAILDDIVEDDRRAGEVVHRLRGLCKKEQAPRQKLDINALIVGVAKILRSDLIAKQMSLKLDLAEGLPEVSGDPVQLQQVLLNLMLNGMDAMLASPHCAHYLEVSTLRAGPDGIEVAVRDHGPGIPPDRLEQVFEPFVTSKPDGLGMGLAIGRSIILAHGGQLWASNHPEGGAVFHFALPICGKGEP